jgi:hypothetical protein
VGDCEITAEGNAHCALSDETVTLSFSTFMQRKLQLLIRGKVGVIQYNGIRSAYKGAFLAGGVLVVAVGNVLKYLF